MTVTIPKLITDTDKYFQYEGSSKPTTQDDLQAFMKNEHNVVECLANKLWQPETSYSQGQVIESPNMPVGFTAVAVTAGISYSNEPDWGDGSKDITDGSVQWHLTKGNITVNGVAPDDNGNIQIDKVNNAGNADIAEKANNDNKGQAITGYVKDISGDSSKLVIVKGDGNEQEVAINPEIEKKEFKITGSTQAGTTPSISVSGVKGISVSVTTVNTIPGLNEGTYELKELLQGLVNLSHSHDSKKAGDSYNCDCDCNCGDDGNSGGDGE